MNAIDPAIAALDDHHLARFLADEAGRALLALREQDLSPRDLKRVGDAGSQDVLANLLATYRPQDAVLSEEARDSKARLAAERVWIIDPLDGTREYSEKPRTDWAVHVALWSAGEFLAGAVTLPAAGIGHDTSNVFDLPQPASKLRLAVSRSRPPTVVDRLAAHLDAELIAMGSAGVKATAVLRGEVDAYVHGGGQYEWDSAAPVAVARAAGLHTSRLDGSPLKYNQDDVLLPDLVVCHKEHAEMLLDAIATVS